MTRVKGGVHALKRRRKVLKAAKGFMWGRKSKERLAKEALLHAWSYAFRGRKEKKRDYRALWQIKMSAGARAEGISYSKLIGLLHKAGIQINRKMLATLAESHPAAFKEVVASVKK
jgi:large subunit ribosomal protein L20